MSFIELAVNTKLDRNKQIMGIFTEYFLLLDTACINLIYVCSMYLNYVSLC